MLINMNSSNRLTLVIFLICLVYSMFSVEIVSAGCDFVECPARGGELIIFNNENKMFMF